jgi:hypothetical protein
MRARMSADQAWGSTSLRRGGDDEGVEYGRVVSTGIGVIQLWSSASSGALRSRQTASRSLSGKAVVTCPRVFGPSIS